MSAEAGALLRTIRDAIGVSVAQVAEVSGVSAGTISRIEREGVAGCRRSTIEPIVTALGELAMARVALLARDTFAPESSYPGTTERKQTDRERRRAPATSVLRSAPTPPTLDDLSALLTDQAGLWKAAWQLLDHARQQKPGHD